MTWLNPAALVGLLALAVPVLVHLFGRRIARRQRFPSLRLLNESRPTPATKSQPSDVLLLVVRCAVIAAAALALAQPLWPTADRGRDALRPVRVILVDTSASMRRLTSGSTALEQARARARQLRDSSRNILVIETDRPGHNVPASVSWLTRHSGLREVVVISDFQVGSVHAGQIASTDSGIGVRLERVATPSPPESVERAATPGGLEGLVRLEVSADRTEATWLLPARDSTNFPRILAGAEERDAVGISVEAVRTVAASGVSTGRRMALVLPEYEGRDTLATQVAALDSAWHGDVLVAMRRDPVLASLAGRADVNPACEAPGTPLAHNEFGLVVASLARIRADTSPGLLVFTCAGAGTVATAAVLAAMVAAADSMPPMQELEPAIIPDEILRRWERPPVDRAPRGVDETSPDGRWIWGIALALLVLEEWIRRRSPRRALVHTPEVPHERVA